jgi:hypothetical protein
MKARNIHTHTQTHTKKKGKEGRKGREGFVDNFVAQFEAFGRQIVWKSGKKDEKSARRREENGAGFGLRSVTKDGMFVRVRL